MIYNNITMNTQDKLNLISQVGEEIIGGEELKKQEITGNLVQMSVGIEDPEIVVDDSRQALKI